ncbi:MAG: hypothetical protein LH606_13225 [Cytophagaceae bacterium]|nr:hypothetical protein [Cytophagaceae bacterium]
MQLPESERVDVSKLAAIFADTTNSYKFYWLLAILDSLRETSQTRLSMPDLSLRMVANVWYPLDYFKLSFGKQDGFKPIASFVSERITVDNGPTASSLFHQLNARLSVADLAQLHRKVGVLLNWVPYRFIRPFFALETRGLPDQQVNARIAELTNRAFDNQAKPVPYKFLGTDIELSEVWAAYLRQHQGILRGFTLWHLVRFLQKHNPNVIGLSEKLEKPGVRVLNTANKFWKDYLQENPTLTCIYSGQPITTANLSLDHFLPWSFVAHDQLWNIIPTSKSVNSAKNNWLPSVELYFDAYAQLQYEGFQFHARKSNVRLLEDYSVLFAQSLNAIQNQPFTWFRERLEQTILPQLQTAQNLGFSHPFEYKQF